MTAQSAINGVKVTPAWTADVLPGFERITLGAADAFDGPVDVVLVRRLSETSTGSAVLYVHGFVDYFFQTHLAEFFIQQGLHFYAVDLRRHGRSLRRGQRPNFTMNFDEFLEDVNIAVEFLRKEEGVNWLLLKGHSTGGLVAALYAHRGLGREHVGAVFLNSPYLDTNLPTWKERMVEPLIALLGRRFPLVRIPGFSQVYGQSLHEDHHGQWKFNTEWKPIEGFPVFAGWFTAVHRAQAEVQRGLNIECPCLVMHAHRSSMPIQWNEDAMTSDVILNVEDISRLSERLGTNVEIQAIPNGVHDLILSKEASRNIVWGILRGWLVRIRNVGMAGLLCMITSWENCLLVDCGFEVLSQLV